MPPFAMNIVRLGRLTAGQNAIVISLEVKGALDLFGNGLDYHLRKAGYAGIFS